MYLLDTNVISELRKAKAGKADPKVVAWAERIPAPNLFLSVITLLELETGLLAVLDVEHFPLVRQWYAVHQKGKKLSSTARMFLDFLLRDGVRIWQEVQPHIRKLPGIAGTGKKGRRGA